MEIGFLCGSFESDSKYLLPTALFRYGITRHIELRFAELISGTKNKETSKTSFGFSDMELGAKFQILKQESINCEIAFISHVIIPSGSADLTNNHFGTVNKIAVSHGLNEFLDLGYNFGYNNFGS